MRHPVDEEYLSDPPVSNTDKNRSSPTHCTAEGPVLPAEASHAVIAGLVATHGKQLNRFLLARVRNVSDVPDIAQEVYLRMLRVPHIESVRSPEAYLFTVAQHVVYQHMLRQSTAPASVDLSLMLSPPRAAPDTDPALSADAMECLEGLQSALDELSPRARATFILHRRDGLSFDEIAARLGISRPMVKKYLVRALMQFRKRLGRAD